MTATPSRPPIAVQWEELEIAAERNSTEIDSYLDLRTGAVMVVVEGEIEAARLREKIQASIDDYLRVEPVSSREQYRWMERFVQTVAEGPLRDRLLASIDGKGAFRRFKDVLSTFPSERERWFAYRAVRLRYHLQQWLAGAGVGPLVPPPWGIVTEPTDDDVVIDAPLVRPVVTEAPGESMRRQARELIETLPAIELEAAIAFLTFLGSRNR